MDAIHQHSGLEQSPVSWRNIHVYDPSLTKLDLRFPAPDSYRLDTVEQVHRVFDLVADEACLGWARMRLWKSSKLFVTLELTPWFGCGKMSYIGGII